MFVLRIILTSANRVLKSCGSTTNPTIER